MMLRSRKKARIPIGSWLPVSALLSFSSSFAAEAVSENAEAPMPDKSGYNLFNPTPRKFMRPLSSDRPDKTDSPYTVDAGHFQVEMDFGNVVVDEHNPGREEVRFTAYEVAPVNLKAGLFNNVDAQFVLSPWRYERLEDRARGTIEEHSGFGDLVPRLKVNLVGNDGGHFALAVMPFVKLPTSEGGLGNNAIEGGLKVPYAFEVPGWDVGLQTEVDFNRDGAGSEHHCEFINSISVGRALFGGLGAYVEFYSNISTESAAPWIGTIDTWLTYKLTDDWRLDAGVYIGVTRAAEDWHSFIGMSKRF